MLNRLIQEFCLSKNVTRAFLKVLMLLRELAGKRKYDIMVGFQDRQFFVFWNSPWHFFLACSIPLSINIEVVFFVSRSGFVCFLEGSVPMHTSASENVCKPGWDANKP